MSDVEHAEALANTGYWGKRAGGAMFFSTKTNRFMVGLRSEEVLQPNTVGVFGGAIDAGEDVEEAIMREVFEETGLNPDCPNIIGMREIYIFEDGDFKYHNYVILVHEEFTPTLNWENSEHYWFTHSQLSSHQNLHFGMISMFEDEECAMILDELTH